MRTSGTNSRANQVIDCIRRGRNYKFIAQQVDCSINYVRSIASQYRTGSIKQRACYCCDRKFFTVSKHEHVACERAYCIESLRQFNIKKNNDKRTGNKRTINCSECHVRITVNNINYKTCQSTECQRTRNIRLQKEWRAKEQRDNDRINGQYSLSV